MKKIVAFTCLIFIALALFAQDDSSYGLNEDSVETSFNKPIGTFMKNRAPLFAKFGIIQKVYKPAEFIFDKDEAQFERVRSHSMGIGGSLEFALNNTPDFDGMWTVSTSFYLTSYSLNFRGVFPGERFGFESDAITTGKVLLSAIEGAIKVNRYKQIKPNLFLFGGVGINVQNVPLRNSLIQGFSRISQDGVMVSQQMFQNEGSNFFISRNPVAQSINTIWSIGLAQKFQSHNMFMMEMRFCRSKTIDLKEKLNSQFGIEGELWVHKGFVGIDLSYMFTINQKHFNTQPID